jgi:hypothetical protein
MVLQFAVSPFAVSNCVKVRMRDRGRVRVGLKAGWWTQNSKLAFKKIKMHDNDE